MSGNGPRVEDIRTVAPPRAGFFGWLAVAKDGLDNLQATWRANRQQHPRRTWLLTGLVIFAVMYPVLHTFFFAPFSRTVFPLPLPGDTEMVFMLIFGVMAIGLNIVIGYAGLLDLGYVAFYALGAYTAAFLASPHWAGVSWLVLSDLPPGFPGIHLPFWFILPIAAGVAAFFGALLGAPTLRLRGDYLAIVTLGFGEIVPVIFKNLVHVNLDLGFIKLVDVNLTGGALGINPIDAPNLFGIKFGATGGVAPVYLMMVLTVLAILFSRNLERSRMGRAWAAIREDEIAAEMMGVNTVRTKLLAFALGASLAGIAGSVQAAYLGATTSDFFTFSTSILVGIMIILGGVGNIWGVLSGALVLIYVDKVLLSWIGQRFGELGRALDNDVIAKFNPASVNFLLFGILLVAMMRFRPEGFLPSRQRTAELHHTKQDIAATVVAEAVESGAELPTGDLPDAPSEAFSDEAPTDVPRDSDPETGP